MTAASTMTVTVIDASLTVALVVASVDLASVLTSVCWHFIGWYSSQDVVPVSPVFFVIFIGRVIDLGSDCSGAELSLDKSVASFASIRRELAAARASALAIRLTGHTLAFVVSTVGTARLAGRSV